MPTKPKPAFPTPAATLPGEADILANVLANLADHDAKLVYADWLDEHGDPRGPLLRNSVTAYRAGKKPPKVKLTLKPWADLVGLSLMAHLRASALAPKSDVVLAAARPAISFERRGRSEDAMPVGASRYGERPDLAAGTKWPEDRGEPLSFLLQFNLAELQVSPVARELPARGLLSLFCLYDYGTDFTKRNWRLLYFADASNLVRTEQHADLSDDNVAPPGAPSFLEILTLPDANSPRGKELLRAVRAVDPDGEAYTDLYERADMGGGDMLLGRPHPFEGDVLGKKSVRHLLTHGEGAGESWWPDGNMMYVTISDAELKQARFDRAKATLQCF